MTVSFHRYTVNLVVFFVDKKLPGTFLLPSCTMQNGHTIHSITSLSGNSAEMPDRTNGLSLLPVSSKDEDGRTKEELHKLDGRMRDEFHKLLNGNTVDATDRVL